MSRIEKIEIKPNQYVFVDKDAKIEDNYYCLQDNNVGTSNGYKIVKCVKADNLNGEHNFGDYTTGRVAKIIAASPELNLEGVPTYYIDWSDNKESIPTKMKYKDEILAILLFLIITGLCMFLALFGATLFFEGI